MNMENKPEKTPFVDILRSVTVDSFAEITERNGWSYHANYVGRVMHEAADRIEKLKADLETSKQNAFAAFCGGVIFGMFIMFVLGVFFE